MQYKADNKYYRLVTESQFPFQCLYEKDIPFREFAEFPWWEDHLNLQQLHAETATISNKHPIREKN